MLSKSKILKIKKSIVKFKTKGGLISLEFDSVYSLTNYLTNHSFYDILQTTKLCFSN